MGLLQWRGGSKGVFLTFDIFIKDVIDDWINVFINIFEEKWKAIFDGEF